MPIGAYVPVGNTAEGGCRPGAVALHEYIIDRWGAGVGSFGCYNPNSRAGSGWSLHREGRAIDVSIAKDVRNKGDDIFHWAVRNADSLGLQEIQWAGQIWTSRRSQEGIRKDTSPAGKLHYDHIHVGLADGYTFTPPGETPLPPILEEDFLATLNDEEKRIVLDQIAETLRIGQRTEDEIHAIYGAMFQGPFSMQKLAQSTWRTVKGAEGT